ncbi:hypothetical protein BJ684DRAFT_16752, partial [Piptocephalis cylindrospora]
MEKVELGADEGGEDRDLGRIPVDTEEELRFGGMGGGRDQESEVEEENLLWFKQRGLERSKYVLDIGVGRIQVRAVSLGSAADDDWTVRVRKWVDHMLPRHSVTVEDERVDDRSGQEWTSPPYPLSQGLDGRESEEGSIASGGESEYYEAEEGYGIDGDDGFPQTPVVKPHRWVLHATCKQLDCQVFLPHDSPRTPTSLVDICLRGMNVYYLHGYEGECPDRRIKQCGFFDLEDSSVQWRGLDSPQNDAVWLMGRGGGDSPLLTASSIWYRGHADVGMLGSKKRELGLSIGLSSWKVNLEGWTHLLQELPSPPPKDPPSEPSDHEEVRALPKVPFHRVMLRVRARNLAGTYTRVIPGDTEQCVRVVVGLGEGKGLGRYHGGKIKGGWESRTRLE